MALIYGALAASYAWPQYVHGALVWLESPIHVSNVMKAEKYDARKANKR